GSLAQLRVLVQEQAVAAARLAEEQRVVVGLPGAALEREQPRLGVPLAYRLGRAVVRGVVQNEQLVVHVRGMRPPDRAEAVEQVVAPVRVHDAVRELDQPAASSSTASARSASWSRP